MPCFNEEATIVEIVGRVLASPFTGELIIVDDASSDRTVELVAGFDDQRVRLIRQPMNQGKGAALSTGFKQVTGDVVLIQDADLEYDPDDYGEMLHPMLDGKADVVFGSRLLAGATSPGAVLLALRGEPLPHAREEHVHQPEPHRHGDLLQGLPAGGASSRSSSRRTGSASNPS